MEIIEIIIESYKLKKNVTMDNVVYLDSKANELDNLATKRKTMIIRGAMGRKLPYGKVHIGDVLFFIENNGDGLIKAKAIVADVFNSEKMTGLDYYYNGAGKLDIRLAPSVPFMFSDGYELSVSELIAFLGELVYNPSACLSSNISWQQVSDYAAKATIEDAGLSVSGIFYFDDNYLITRFESNDRYFGDTKNKLPWIVYMQDYKTFSGLEIPSTFKAVWIKPEGEYEYINATITNLLFDVKTL